MTTLDRRIEALESACGGNMPDVFITRHIVAPGRIGEPIIVAEIDGEQFNSAPGETEDQFIERVRQHWSEAPKPTGGRRPVVILRADDEDEATPPARAVTSAVTQAKDHTLS